MKKRTVKAIVVMMVMVVLMGCMGYIDTHYTRKDCEVVEVEQGLMTIVDTCGYEWTYYSDEEVHEVGTVVNLKMHTNNTTDNIEDDEILKIIAQK